MSRKTWPRLLGMHSLVSMTFVYLASQDNIVSLSPQGCRMSWMSPSYILQSDFDGLWTPLSRRYSLWLYREVEWDTATKPQGNPVIFIPGNAGSSRQVRSIASSAARQYYTSPGILNPVFTAHRPLDFYAVEFNEDLSALHGPTIETQREYVSKAISYILSNYHGPRRQILIIGHSMGGIVARSLLASSHDGWNASDIEAIVTMSTPHSLPPARFDQVIERIYSDISAWECSDSAYVNVPILSICGGSTDALIPSETCVLPPLTGKTLQKYNQIPWYRRTVHTTALSGVWTGVGHREMVWCHQVRSRVARVALELGGLNTAHLTTMKGHVIDRWFHSYTDNIMSIEQVKALPSNYWEGTYTIVNAPTLRISSPPTSHTYLLPVPMHNQNLTVMIGKGILTNPALTPTLLSHLSNALRVSLYVCSAVDSGESPSCEPLSPNLIRTSRMLPFARPNGTFPHEEGADETDWVLYCSGDVESTLANRWIGVKIEPGGEGSSDTFVLAGFDQERHFDVPVSTYELSFREKHISLDQLSFIPFKTSISLPNLNSNSLLVYSLDYMYRGSCNDHRYTNSLISRIILSSNDAEESQFYVPSSSRRMLLSGHTYGPFIPPPAADQGSIVEIYTSGECGLKEVTISLHWKASIGRAGTRYWSSLPMWVIGVVYLSVGVTWISWDVGYGDLPDPTEALRWFTFRVLPKVMLILFLLSLLPLPPQFLLGNVGSPLFASLVPACVVLATGIAWILWEMILGVVSLITTVRRIFGPSGTSFSPYTTTFKVFVGLFLCLLAKFMIPIQVIYLLLYVRHIWRCSRPQMVRLPSAECEPSSPSSKDFPSVVQQSWEIQKNVSSNSDVGFVGIPTSSTLLRTQQLHILLLLSVLFPFVGSTLAVWLRTLATAGLSAPFHGDHNLWRVVAFVCVVESSDQEIRRGKRWLAWLTSVPLYLVSIFAFLLGPRYSYGVYIMANLAMTAMYARIHISRNLLDEQQENVYTRT